MKLSEAEKIISGSVDKYMAPRALEMFAHMTSGSSQATSISKLKVPTGWPLAGNITFFRDADSKKIAIGYNKKTKKFMASAK
jgi:hypothetical protein